MGDADSPAALERTIARYNEAWNSHDLDAIIEHPRPRHGVREPHRPRAGRGRGGRAHIASIFETWPDIRFESRRTYCREALVVQEWTATATHANQMRRGDLVAEPTGRPSPGTAST